MNEILTLIADHKRHYRQHPVMLRLQREDSVVRVVRGSLVWTFWIIAFQDCTRLLVREIQDPGLRETLARHQKEDAGHQKWFLADLAQLDLEPPSVRRIFEVEHQVSRDMTYELLSELLSAQSDWHRLILLLAIEATGDVFFENSGRLVARAGGLVPLRFYSHAHYHVESSHSIHEDHAYLNGVVLEPTERARLSQLVERVFSRFSTLMDAIERQIVAEAER
jgi:hypothetical protein